LSPNDYAHELNRQLIYLISFVRSVNELDLAAALLGEFRGMQDAGWSTVQTAHEAFTEMQALGSQKEPLTTAQYRQMLCLYTHLAEAGGVYESLINLIGVIQLKPYNLWPFQDLVRVKKSPGRVIGPNANAMFRRLAEQAAGIGMSRLSELLEMTFRDDIRNGIAHADYIIGRDGLRLRRRNGGNPFVLSHPEVNEALNVGMMFFDLLKQLLGQAAQFFRPARTIIGRFSLNPPMPWTVELKEDGSFSISGSSPGPRTDATFDRQERINNRLGGRVMMAYACSPSVWGDLQAEIRALGFEVPIVELDATQLAELEVAIAQHGLGKHPELPEEGLLLAMPQGFCRIADIDTFHAELPEVEELEIS